MTAATQPYCRFCGTAIRKRTTTVIFVDVLKSHMKNDGYIRYQVGRPMSKAEAQKLVNEQIVSVRRGEDPWNMTAGSYVHQVSVWDGASYVDPFFCNGKHAQDFAYALLRSKAYENVGMPAWLRAMEENR